MSKSLLNRLGLASLVLFLLGSCSMNSIFLHPYTLKRTDTFSHFVEEKNDTLTLKFDEHYQATIVDSKNQVQDLDYSIESGFMKKSTGDSLNFWILEPKGNKNGTAIYFLHGNAGNLVYQYGFMTPFVKMGYTVFMIDYSEFGFSQGEATRDAVYEDATLGLDYLINQSGIEYEHLLIYGQSLGGHLSVVIANENQDKIDGLIIEGAFSSHKNVASDRVPILGRIFTKEIYSAEKNIVAYKKPLLVIHSTEDETIPYKHGERLFSLGNEPKHFYSIDKPHICGPLYYADSIADRLQNLLK